MTIDEAIEYLGNDWFISLSGQVTVNADKKERFLDAIKMSIIALRAQQEAASGVLRTIYDTPESCPHCYEHLSLEWSYCPECGEPTSWNEQKSEKSVPLTLEDLQRKIGEPVWVVTDERQEWMIVHSYHGPEVCGRCIIMTSRAAVKRLYLMNECGATWNAYCRPPKKEV